MSAIKFCVASFSMLVCAAAQTAPARPHAADSVPQMIESVLPGVVTVTVEKAGISAVFGAAGQSPASMAYSKMLDITGAEESGSGFVIAENGKLYVVTNAHVIQAAVGDTIFAFSVDQTKYKMKLAGADTFYDIAILAFADPQPGKEIHALAFRASDPQVGETVYAIGNPFGRYPYSVTSGIIGGKNRVMLGLTGRFGYLQSSAPIIWGNSGGPLLDRSGSVLGVNTQIEVQRGQAFPEMGFALQSAYAVRLARELLSNGGRLRRAYLGLSAAQLVVVHGEARQVVSKPFVARVIPGSVAAGKLAGYLGAQIEAVNGKDIADLDDLMFALEQLKPQERVTFDLVTEKDKRHDRVEMQAGELTPDNLVRLGLSFLETEFHITPREQGDVVVAEVSSGELNPKVARISSDARIEEGDRYAYKRMEVPSRFRIVAAGSRAERFFRVQNLRDLAVAVKLMAPTGQIDLVRPSEVEDQAWMVSGELRLETAIRRTLLY